MNKNTIIGSILIAVIVIWWMTLSQSNAKREADMRSQNKNTSTAVADTNENQLTLEDKAPQKINTPLLGDESVPLDSSASEEDSTLVRKTIVPRTVKVETDKFTMTLTNVGGKIQSVVAKVLEDTLGHFPELIQDTSLGALDLKIGKADLKETLFDLGDTPDSIYVSKDTTISFVFNDQNNKKVIRHYKFSKDGISVRQVNQFVGFKPNDYELSWNGGMKETEVIPKGKSFGGASYFFSEVIFNNTSTVERETISSPQTFNKDEGKIIWAGLRRKYIAMAVEFDSPMGITLNAKPMKNEENDKDPGTYKISMSDNLRDADSLAFNFMVLPLKWHEVEALGKGYEKVIVSGWTWCGADVWFVWICSMLLTLLKFFFSIIPNYGVAIILVTLIVRGVTTPFTMKQLKSTKAMSKLKPELDEINVKYRSDPQKKQAAIMELYAKNGVNPLASCTGGCLPMLIQMPIFMGLFFVLGRAIELRGMPAFLWIQDLSKSDVVFSGFSIPYLMPSGIAILPWIMVVTTYFQTKVTMSGSAGMDPAQQKMMAWMMPIMMFLFSAVMPSGLVLYWIISNFWSIAQYKIINRGSTNNTSPKLKGKDIKNAEIVKK